MNTLSSYDRIDLKKEAQVLISFNPSSGKITRFRLVRSTYVRELDNIVMNDAGGLEFQSLRAKTPATLLVVYHIYLRDSSHY